MYTPIPETIQDPTPQVVNSTKKVTILYTKTLLVVVLITLFLSSCGNLTIGGNTSHYSEANLRTFAEMDAMSAWCNSMTDQLEAARTSKRVVE